MNRRHIQQILIATLSVVLAYLGLSMVVMDREKVPLRRIDASDFRPGEARLIVYRDTTRHETYSSPTTETGISHLVIRKYDGAFLGYYLPTWNGAVAMPRSSWWEFSGLCRDFGPDLKEGKLQPEGAIRCRDTSGTEEQRKNWVWSLNGKHESGQLPDLISVLCKVEPDAITLCNS
jgi:hypothetical protein